jgi:hypothetical protein
LKDEVPVFAERHLIKCRTADGALRWT